MAVIAGSVIAVALSAATRGSVAGVVAIRGPVIAALVVAVTGPPMPGGLAVAVVLGAVIVAMSLRPVAGVSAMVVRRAVLLVPVVTGVDRFVVERVVVHGASLMEEVSIP